MRTLALSLALGCFVVADARGQAGQAGAAEQAEQKSAGDTARAPQAIPAERVAPAAQQADERLRRLRVRLEVDRAVSRVAQQVPDYQAEVEQASRAREAIDPGTLGRRELYNLRQRWLSYKNQLDAWSSLLAGRLSTLQAASAALDSLEARWTATRQAEGERDYPAAARQQIGSVLEAAAGVREPLRQRLDAVVTLQNQIADASIRVTAVLERIDQAELELQRRLVTRDSPPLWRAWPSAAQRAQYLAELRSELAIEIGTLRRYVARNQDRLLLQLGVFVLLLALLRGLQRRSQEAIGEERESAAAHLLTHPYSTALLIALFLTGAIQRDPPRLLRDLVELVGLIPILRLLPAMLPRGLRRPLYGLAGLYLLNWLSSLVPSQSLFGRLLQLLVAVSGLMGAALLLRQSGTLKDSGASRWWGAVRLFLQVAVAAFAIACIANLLGYVALTEFLNGTMLIMAFLAVALYALDRVLEGLIPVLMRTRVGQAINIVKRHSQMVRRRAIALVRVGVVVLWIGWSLSVAGLWRYVVAVARVILGTPLTVGSMSISLGNVVAFILALWVAVTASRLTRLVLEEDVLPRIDLPRGVPGAISKTVNYAIIAIGIFVAIAAAGLDLSRLTIILGALGVGIGFGLQNVVNNFISGLILVFERPIQEGDTIQLADLMGEVKRIGIRSSTVRTYDGAEVIVPNGNLISNDVINWTLSDRHRRIEVPVGVAYGTDPERVLRLLEDVARSHPRIHENPEPYGLFQGFGDSSLNFVLRCWTDYDGWWLTSSEITVGVNRALKEAKIEIPFPQRDLHVRSVNAAAGRTLRGKPGEE